MVYLFFFLVPRSRHTSTSSFGETQDRYSWMFNTMNWRVILLPVPYKTLSCGIAAPENSEAELAAFYFITKGFDLRKVILVWIKVLRLSCRLETPKLNDGSLDGVSGWIKFFQISVYLPHSGLLGSLSLGEGERWMLSIQCSHPWATTPPAGRWSLPWLNYRPCNIVSH